MNMITSNDIEGHLPIKPGRFGGGVSTDYDPLVDVFQTMNSNSSEYREKLDSDTAFKPTIEYDEEQDGTDLLPKVKGLFRLLDLYSENGGGCLVDKIIISKESLSKLIDCLSPGAYKSMNTIDFESLNDVLLKPMGVYGSKSELVRFLKDINAIDDYVASMLLEPVDVSSHIQATLRSGLYALVPQDNLSVGSPGDAFPFYVLYWPEDRTWDDRDSGKNRVTFMHYLTRLTDQVRSLISLEHEESLVLHDLSVEVAPQRRVAVEDSESSDDEVCSRFHKFEVAKATDEEEVVKLAPKFTFSHPAIVTGATVPEVSDSVVSLPSVLVTGENVQAFLGRTSYPRRQQAYDVSGTFTPARLQSQLNRYPNIVLNGLGAADVDILMQDGNLRRRQGIYNKYNRYREAYRAITTNIQGEKERYNNHYDVMEKKSPHLRRQIRQMLLENVAAIYPTLDLTSNGKHLPTEEETDRAVEPSDPAHPASLKSFLDVDVIIVKVVDEARFDQIPNTDGYIDFRARLVTIRHLISKQGGLSDRQREELGRSILSENTLKRTSAPRRSSNNIPAAAVGWTIGALGLGTGESHADDIRALPSSIKYPSDPDFIQSLNDVAEEDPIYVALAARAASAAQAGLRQLLKSTEDRLVSKIESEVRKKLESEALEGLRQKEVRERQAAFRTFTDEIRADLAPDPSKPALIITGMQEDSTKAARYKSYRMQAHTSQIAEAEVIAYLWSLSFTDYDRQRMLEDPGYVPTPRVEQQPTFTFSLPPNFNMRHIQILGSNTCLLIAESAAGVRLWLTPMMLKRLDWLNPTRKFPITGEYVVAVDEQHRRLVFVMFGKTRLTIYVYAFDDDYSNVHARGSPIELSRWYPEGVPVISSACFFSGTDDLCLVESSGRIRVFSFLTQTFRPKDIQLETSPISVQSSPDGSALVVVRDTADQGRVINVFHQASWGVKASGIVERLPTSFAATTEHCVSFTAVRNRALLLGLDPSSNTIHGLPLEISREETEYQFRAQKEIQRPLVHIKTEHNSLIDCFSQVWGRYPVVSAIRREVLTSEGRAPSSITFVTSKYHPFKAYFQRMINNSNKTMKKPTGKKLTNIIIRTSNVIIPSADAEIHERSSFKAGEWIIELICLIPLHIAVARENCFIPLKDGVLDKNLERELLDAEVPAIIDSISLGWYESILSSYMVTKPIKVVSSMGEQGVGKSYSLNHFVDSSFAGSAGGTTEGVWLSICPTRDLLVVALDFEGVHSIEKTAQEDMLLVLFNIALSNLVLFRNNFALSRDVANMFTSFQSSTQIFDPGANPTLFKGRLAIVIKDVVDRDTNCIVQEFESKFSQIVSKEQKTNFITVLHDSKLEIIPWSVIESRQFYSLFKGLRELLFQQPTSHASVGEFLLTLKTLMAKLKAQDWGSIDSTVIRHRVSFLSSRLANALSYGQLEIEPSVEPLKNLDTRQLITSQPEDTATVFSLDKSPMTAAVYLQSLLDGWKKDAAREDVEGITHHLDAIAQARVLHVAAWLNANLARFSADNADIRALRQSFDHQAEFLRSSVQLCLSECSTCHLRCMLNKSHDQLSQHDCRTTHRCDKLCTYSEEHESEVICGLQAGHNGRHLCNTSLHLCGEPCRFSDKRGCQHSCTRPSDHTDGIHECSARMHQCGQPCDLQRVETPPGVYSCAGFCTLPHDIDHEVHSCENRLICPVRCALCPRYCTTGDHFHGKEEDVVHLCGKEHPCSYMCERPGFCEIITTPEPVETPTYTGRFPTFQYTKYFQKAKRNRCAKLIPPGALLHEGGHVHSLKPDVFHYCQARCGYCNNVCQLPFGHAQREHETTHGSMENTRWAIEGNEDATIEIGGRKYGIYDSGAPMYCSIHCKHLGRHAHIAYCDSKGAGPCQKPESEHITIPMLPNPEQAKDWVSHKQFWAQTGFRDPYSREDQEEFGRCDYHCAGPEHDATDTAPANPSYCTLPIFHPPQPLDSHSGGHDSHVSTDGHSFACPDPNTVRRAFRVIFELDRLPGTPL